MWYNLKNTPDGYRMAKFDFLFNVDAVYEIQHRRGRLYCDCEQGRKSPTCRHRTMVSIFCSRGVVDHYAFYNYDTGEWC